MIRDMTIKYEAVLIGSLKNKDGEVIKLAIHPNDLPMDLARARVGTRYMVAMVEVGDDDQPKAGPATEKGEKALSMAGMLCRTAEFQEWMFKQGHAKEASEEACKQGLRSYLGVNSRSELLTNEDARERLIALRAEFEEYWRRRNV